MKQQEILKKIGSILKELNEQYDYLQAEEAHTNDLELELFAANAKFLTDHTEILRKVNAQAQNLKLTLPEHTETQPETFSANIHEPEMVEEPTPFAEAPLLPLAESALTFNPYIQPEGGQETTPEPQVAAAEPKDDHTYYPVAEEEQPAENHTEPVEEQTFQFTATDEPEPEINIQPEKEFDSYNYLRHEPQVSNEQHTFSLSSTHTEEEPAPEHVDLSAYSEPAIAEEAIVTPEPIAEEQPETHEPYQTFHTHEPEPVAAEEAQPVFTHEAYQPAQNDYAEPVNIAPAEPEPIAPAPAEEAKPFTYEAYKPAETPAYAPAPPVVETPEPEQPLTLNQRLSAQLHGHAGGSSHSQQPQAVSDIKQAISMNDKLLFVKDLFNGYGMAYGEAIELLNRCKTFDEADRFLKTNYVTKNSWPDKPATVDKFYAVLHRRFTE